MSTKKCSDCKLDLPIDSFYKAKRGSFGRKSTCKDCQHAYMREYHKNRLISDPTYKDKCNSWAYDWTEKNKEKRAAIAKRRNMREKSVSPEKVKCRALVNQKVRFGRMPRASSLKCVGCGVEAKHYHHHKGYAFDNRYDVVPVCTACHKKMDPT